MLASLIEKRGYADGQSPTQTTSGGNQQKVINALWLATEPRVLLLNDPTRGVDHATSKTSTRGCTKVAAGGITIVMLSTEVDELLTYIDQVMVFREGALFTEFRRDDIDRQRLIASFFGREQTLAHPGPIGVEGGGQRR